MEGGDLQVATWIKDEGFDTTIPSVMQVRDFALCCLGTPKMFLLAEVSSEIKPTATPSVRHQPLTVLMM